MKVTSMGSERDEVVRVGPGRGPPKEYRVLFEEGLFEILEVRSFIVDEAYLQRAKHDFWGAVGDCFHEVRWRKVRKG